MKQMKTRVLCLLLAVLMAFGLAACGKEKTPKDPNLVGALSGHKEGSRAFARYRTIDDDLKKEMISFLD